MDPLETQDPSALVQFAICIIMAAFFAAVLFGFCQ